MQLGYSRYGKLNTDDMRSSLCLCIGAIGTYGGVLIDNEWPIGIYVLNCTGDEADIWKCMYHTNDSMDGLNCSQGTYASVSCMCK